MTALKALLILALAALAIPLAWLNDAVNPVVPAKTGRTFYGNCLAAVQQRGKTEMLNQLVMAHVNDTVRVDLRFYGCTPARGDYVYRVEHTSTGRLYEHAGRIRGSQATLPLFTAEVGGVYRVTLQVSFEAEGYCDCEATLVIVRGGKEGYARVYSAEALAGGIAAGLVALYAYWRYREVA